MNELVSHVDPTPTKTRHLFWPGPVAVLMAFGLTSSCELNDPDELALGLNSGTVGQLEDGPKTASNP